MKTPAIDDVLRPLRAARFRLSAQFFLLALVKALLLAGGALLIYGSFNRWVGHRLPWDTRSLGLAGAGALCLALLATIRARPTLPHVAALLDRVGGTKDRFLTALEFSTTPQPGAFHLLAIAECVRYLRDERFQKLIRVRAPRQAAYLLAPALSLGLLQWEARDTFSAEAAEKTAARAAVEDTAKNLEHLARETARAAEERNAAELQRLAEQLQRGAAQLRSEAVNPDQARKSALREVSALEEMVRELQKPPSAVTPEEMQALARALAENKATKEAASALAAGDPAKAAEALEKAAAQLDEQKDQAAAEQLRKSLEQAIKQLAQEKQLSEALQKVAREMQSANPQQGGNSSEPPRLLAEMLRKMAEGKSGARSSGKQNEQTLQGLLAALQNMQSGEGQEPQPSQAPPGNQPSNGVKMESFAQSNRAGASGEGNPDQPSGHPGGEHDTGTTDAIIGKTNTAGDKGSKQRVSGQTGEGESLQQTLLSAGDHSKSNRRYKDLYEAMAPAAQDAVLQEDIPLGSRFFIKRYFEAIRPLE